MSKINPQAIKLIAEIFDQIYSSIYIQDGVMLRESIRNEIYAYEWHRITIRTEWKQNGQRYEQETTFTPEDFKHKVLIENRIKQHIELIQGLK